MPSLGQEALLGAMIGATAVVWAISVAVYQFIYEYFDRRYGDEARYMAGWKRNGVPFAQADVNRMLSRLQDNERTFREVRTAGGIAVVSIMVSVLVLLLGLEALVPVAVLAFVTAMLTFLWVFTREINTSICQMHHYDRDIRDKLPLSPPPIPPPADPPGGSPPGPRTG